MANPPAPEAPFEPGQRSTDTLVYGGYRADDEAPLGEWNPTAETLPAVRGRHRVAKQRGGGFARSSTVLGVGVIAAVSAGGMASANTGKPPVTISMPDLPSVGSLISDDSDSAADDTSAFSSVGATTVDTAKGTSDAGEALRSRILAQAERQQDQIDTKAAQAVAAAAEKEADAAAAKAEKDAQEKAAAAKKEAEEAAAKKAEAARLAELAKQYTLPTSSYTITGTFGQAGSLWSSGYHTGLDFAAPTGTLIKAIHSGTITEAGWAGSYGYRTILTLDDGTELWFCHQSSISVSVGQKVGTGDVIGRVGATGNVTGAHLHLEVHPGGSADGIDPMAWLRGKGLNP
ncbi:peptidase [Streptomyces canus]|uniref:Peptidase n=1 Tax=Streptomyces canus TaxID=58343 RepID=A0A101RL92_9ACTN|nr:MULTISPECIES: M23 family metallopeptidase [Streptomyces]KUN57473.1 peptidase [Streptomyces canus]MDI5911015.1 M23 family metallopeptidase [Streptomyces sp. 12257]